MAQSPLNPRISDLSLTGAFVDTLVALPKGSSVRLWFRLPAGEINCAAEVVHDVPQFGMGVRFLDLTPEQRRTIEQVVRERE